MKWFLFGEIDEEAGENETGESNLGIWGEEIEENDWRRYGGDDDLEI
jgi:hypothetical protein